MEGTTPSFQYSIIPSFPGSPLYHLHHAPGFEQAFFVFVLRVGVVGDGAAYVEGEAGAFAVVDNAADHHVEVEVAARLEVAEGPGVDAAAAVFQRFNGLHHPDLRCARHAAHGEGMADDVRI